MLVGQRGYVPEPYFLTETLRSQKRFNDPLQNSLFSNAGSVQGFRKWSSGKPSPQQPTLNGGTTSDTPPVQVVPDPPGKAFLVRSSCPIGHQSTTLEDSEKHVSTQPTCIRVSENVYEELTSGTAGAQKSRMRGIEDVDNASANKKGKSKSESQSHKNLHTHSH